MPIAVRGDAAGTVAYGTGAVTPGLPTGTVTGDILVMVCESQYGEAVTCSGWTEIGSSPQQEATDGTRLTVLWCRYDSTAPVNRTTNDPGDHIIARIVAFSGCITIGDPFNVTAGGTNTSSQTVVEVPSVTTTYDGCMILAAVSFGIDVGSDGTDAFVDCYNNNLTDCVPYIDDFTTSGNGGGLGFAVGIKTLKGATGVTTLETGDPCRKAMWCGALIPLGGTPIIMHHFNMME